MHAKFMILMCFFFYLFFLYSFSRKKNYFLVLYIWLIYTIFFLFLKIYSAWTKEMMFYYVNCNIVLFFSYVKN